MWAALRRILFHFIPKDKLLLYIIIIPIAPVIFLLFFISGPTAAYKHIPLADERQYQFYIDAANRMQAETNVYVNWQEIIAIDAVVLEQDFSRSSPDRAYSYKRYFIREEVVSYPCQGPKGQLSTCFRTEYYPRSFNEVLQMLVSEGRLRSDQIQDVYDYLLFKISLVESDDTGEISLSIEGDFTFKEMLFAWPLPAGNTRITSPFGMRVHPVTGILSGHQGVDIAATIGTSVFAIDDGEVIFAGETVNGGKSVYIRHKNNFVSKYMHLNSILVKNGQQVTKKEIIAYSGNTGRTTGPHLHFQIEQNGKPVNPLLYY